LLLALVSGVAYHEYWSIGLHRFTTFSPGQVYQSAQMPPEQLLQVTSKYGIRSVIDLREITEVPGAVASEARALQAAGVTYLRLPTAALPGEEAVAEFLAFVADPDNLPVLIHSGRGTGRSMLFASLYRVEFEHWDTKAALHDILPIVGPGELTPESAAGRFLLSYEPRRATFAVNAGD
jgi:protein tyrosine/serine phosphatase